MEGRSVLEELVGPTTQEVDPELIILTETRPAHPIESSSTEVVVQESSVPLGEDILEEN